MKIDNKGFTVEAVLLVVSIVGGLLFVSNPISKFLGIGVQPNNIVHTDKVTLINDKNGVPVAYREMTAADSVQQHETFWEWLQSLPIVVIILMLLGVSCPAVGLWLRKKWGEAVADYKDLSGETKRIVVSVKAGLATMSDQASKDKFLAAMSVNQDQSTKDLVKELLKGN